MDNWDANSSSNFVYKLIDLPDPPNIPPTKLKGVSVEDRVEAYECKRTLETALETMGGIAHATSPRRSNEYPIDPSPRRRTTSRIWRTSSADTKESDYETMLPQFNKLKLTGSPTKKRGKPFKYQVLQEHYYYTSESDATSRDDDVISSYNDSRYVIFDSKSKLLMPSPLARITPPEPHYVMLDDDGASENDRSADSGFSDIYQNPSSYLTTDDISLISRYEKVLKKRTKKSRFQKLSEFLCYNGSAISEDEMSDDSDSLYDTLDDNFVSSNTNYKPLKQSPPISTTPDNIVRYSKKNFFYKKPALDDHYSVSTQSSVYVLAEDYAKSSDAISFTSTPLRSSRPSTKPHKHVNPTVSPMKPPKTFSSPTHEYVNARDFTQIRKPSKR